MLRPESVVVSAGRPERTPRAPMATPIVLTAPYHHSPDDNHYMRQASTDTIASFEDAVGALEGGTALAFASGMAAITAVAEAQPVGTVAVVPAVGYSGSTVIFGRQRELGRLDVRPVDIADTDAVIAALDGADLLWLETMTNPMLEIPDLPVLIAAAHDRGAIVGIDSTFTLRSASGRSRWTPTSSCTRPRSTSPATRTC